MLAGMAFNKGTHAIILLARQQYNMQQLPFTRTGATGACKNPAALAQARNHIDTQTHSTAAHLHNCCWVACLARAACDLHCALQAGLHLLAAGLAHDLLR